MDGEPDAVADMDEETQRQDGDHDVDERRGHEVAALLEPTVSMGEEEIVRGYLAESTVEGVDDGEEVDSPVKQEEDDEECAADGLDEFLADGRSEKVCHLGLFC